MKEYTYLNNKAVRRMKHNLFVLGFGNLATKISDEAQGYVKGIFDPEDVTGTYTKQLIEISEEYEILLEEI